MVYSLISLEGKGNESGLGEKRVHIDGLPSNSIVFLFYYLGHSGYTKREAEVSNIGNKKSREDIYFDKYGKD
jgi:hypothetical protein